MQARLSTKGQLVIPKAIRNELGLEPGDELLVELTGRQIVIEPLTRSPIEALHGKYAQGDAPSALDALEEEHRREVTRDGLRL